MATRAGGGAKVGCQFWVPYTGKLKKPKLDNGSLTRIGAQMVRQQLARWKQHKNANGQEAKPLSKRYTFIKRKALGIRGKPYRDQRGVEGLLIPNFTLRKAIDNQIRAENTTRKARQHARQAQLIEEMIGLSGAEQVGIIRSTQNEYGALVKKAFIQVK
jgi:hypothetical protein